MNKIAIIGAGAIGRRHFESLLNLDEDLTITVVDKSRQAIEEVRKISFNRKKNNLKLTLLDKVELISQKIDIAIIATNSNSRFEVAEYLINKKKVKNIIFEKILFSKISEYSAFEKLLKMSDVICWVNHSRRDYQFYKKLREELSGDQILSMKVVGENWSMLSNAIHFIDLLAYLSSDSKNLICNYLNLNLNIINSKREGYIEALGQINGVMSKKIFQIESTVGGGDLIVTLQTDKRSILINESLGIFTEILHSGKKNINENPIVQYQSCLTEIAVNQILHTGNCNLTPITEAMSMHRLYVTEILGFISKNSNNKYNRCQIT